MRNWLKLPARRSPAADEQASIHGSAFISAEALKSAYYRAGSAWYEDRQRHESRNLRFTRAAAVAGLICTVVCVAALGYLSVHRTIAVVTVAIDEKAGIFRKIEYTDAVERFTRNEAYIRNQIYNYVTLMESRVQADRSYRMNQVARLTDAAAKDTLDQLQPRVSGRAEDPRVDATVSVDSISMLDSRTVHASFVVNEKDDAGRVTPRSWVAIITYRFAGVPTRYDDAMVNPFGFLVTGYHKNEAVYRP